MAVELDRAILAVELDDRDFYRKAAAVDQRLGNIGRSASAGSGMETFAAKMGNSLDGVLGKVTRLSDGLGSTVFGFGGGGLTSKLGAAAFGFNQVSQAAQSLGGPLIGVVTGASDVNEALNKSNVTFGASSRLVEEFASTADTSMGLAKGAVLDAAGSLGSMFEAMGRTKEQAAHTSIDVLKLAGDLASFHNLGVEDALAKIRSGLVGEVEPLRSIGVLLDEQTVKARAAELGFKALGGQYDQNAKLTARLSLITEQSRNAIGDFARTSDQAANSSRIVAAQWKNMTDSLGQFFLPTAQKALTVTSGLIGQFNGLSPSIKETIALVGGLAVGLPVATLAIGAMGTGLLALASPIGLAVAGITGLTIAYSQNLFGLKDKLNEFGRDAKQFWIDHGDSIKNTVQEFWATKIKPAFQAGVEQVKKVLEIGGDALKGEWGKALDKLEGTTGEQFRKLQQRAQREGYTTGRIITEALRIDAKIGLESVKDDFAVFFESVGQGVVDFYKSYYSAIIDFFKGIPGVIKSTFESVFSGGFAASFAGFFDGSDKVAADAATRDAKTYTETFGNLTRQVSLPDLAISDGRSGASRLAQKAAAGAGAYGDALVGGIAKANRRAAEEAAKGAPEIVESFTEAAKVAFEKSPLITARVLLGNPADALKAVEELGASVGRSLTGAKQTLVNAGVEFGRSFVEGLSSQTGVAKEIFKKDIEGFAQSFAKVNADLVAGYASSGATIRSVLLGDKTLSGEFEKQMSESFVDLVLKANGLNKQLMKALYDADPAEFEKLNNAIQEQAKILGKSALDSIKHANGIATAINHIFSNSITPADRRYLILAFGALDDAFDETARAAGRAEHEIIESLGTIKAETRSFSQTVRDDLGGITAVFDESLKLRGGIFDDLLPQLEHLASASGQTTEQVVTQWRGMVTDLEASGPKMGVLVAQIDQYLLNSQLTKLEEAWGKPLGRAIEVILGHYKQLDAATANLKNSTLSKVTAIGELFGALPGKLGSSVNKVINEVNSYVNLVTKAANVLQVFGVNLPKPIQDALKVLTGGAQSTTQIMTEMKDSVTSTMRLMKDTILSIFDELNVGMQARFRAGLRELTQGAQIELKSNTEVFQKWEKDVVFTGTDTAQKFGNSLFEGVNKVNINLGGILAGNAALFGGWAGKVTAAVLSVINISRQAGSQLPVIFSATANSISASSISMINSMQGLAAGAQQSLGAFQQSAGQMQSGVGGIVQSIGGLILSAVPKAAQQANQAGQMIHQSLLAGIAGIAAGGFMGGVGIGRATGSKLIGGIGGGLTGAASGALAGMMIGAAGGPIGALGGAIIGGIAGVVGGILGGIKSEFQKTMEREQMAQAGLQTKQMQQQYLQLIEGTKQSWLDTISKGFTLLEQIGASARVPKDILKDAFKGLHQLTKLAVKELNSWKDASLADLKPVSESLTAVFTAIAAGPAAVEAAARSIPVAQSSFDTFFSNVGKLWDGFGSFADGIKNKVRKHSEKFAESFKPVVEIVSPSVDAMANFFKVRKINESDVGVWVGNIMLIETGMAKAADSLDRFGVKDSARLAESGSGILDFLTKYADAQDKIIGIKIPSASDYDNLFTGAKLTLGKAIEFAKDVAREGLQLASEVSNLGSSVFDSLKSEIDFITAALALKDADFSSIPNTIKALWDATKLAVALAAEAANTMDRDLTDKAAKYAIGALDVMKLYGEAAKTFFGESVTVRDIYPAAIENLTFGIELAIRGIVGLRSRITGEMLSEAQSSAAGINAAMSVISNAGSALKPLGIDENGKAPTFSVQAVDNLLNVAEYSVNRINQFAKTVSRDDLNRSVEVAGLTHGIFTNMTDTMGFIKATAEQPATSVASFDAMGANFQNFNTALGKSEGLLHEGKSISERMILIAHGIGDDLREVARSLAASLSQTLGFISGAGAASFASAGAGGGSFSAQSLTPSFVPSFTPPPVVPIAPVPVIAPQQSGGGPRSVRVEQDNSINFNAPIYLNGEAAPEEFASRFADKFKEEMRNRRGRAMQYREDIPPYLREK